MAQVASMLSNQGVNVATMQLYRNQRDGMAVMVLECDQQIPRSGIEKLRASEGVTKVTYLNPEDEK